MFKDNLKGFRKRCMIKKLEILMKQIEDVIEFAYEDCMGYKASEHSVEDAEFIKERIDELEGQYSMIWRIRIQLEKDMRTSKTDLKFVNEIHLLRNPYESKELVEISLWVLI